MTGPDYANNPHLAACARQLDDALRPIVDAILADRGLTRADLAGLVATFLAERAASSAASVTPLPAPDADATTTRRVA